MQEDIQKCIDELKDLRDFKSSSQHPLAEFKGHADITVLYLINKLEVVLDDLNRQKKASVVIVTCDGVVQEVLTDQCSVEVLDKSEVDEDEINQKVRGMYGHV